MLKLNPRKYAPAAIVLGALLLAVGILASRPSPEPRPPAPAPPAGVATLRAAPGLNQPRVVTQGSVQVRHRADLVAQVGGIIESVTPLFNAGSQFQRGDLLLEIESQDYRNALAQARAELANAEQLLTQERAQSEQARREWRDLGSDEANRLFLREPQLRSAEARLAAAQAALAQAELNLQRTLIRAPFTGELQAVKAGLGQYVAPGTPLASIGSTEELEVQTSVTAEQLGALGWSAWIGQLIAEPPRVQVSWRGADGERQASGTLRSIGSLMQANTQLYPLYIDLHIADNPQGLPFAGQFVEVELRGKARPNSLWVPRTALYERDSLLVIVDGQLQVLPIEVLANTPQDVLVSGVSPGDLIVRQRPLWVLPGQNVTPIFTDGQE